MWAIGGWMILLAGEFTKTYRYSPHSVRVDGPAAIVMAYIFFLLSTVAAVVVLQSLGTRRSTWVATGAIILVAPAAYLIAQ